MIILDEIVSADGFAARDDGDIDWFVEIPGLVDAVTFADRMPDVSAVLLGARTYRQFAAYWPTQSADLDVNRLPKHVLSNSLAKAPWGALPPAVVEKGGAAEVARRLAETYDGHVIVWGSLSLAEQLLRDGAVGEIWLRVVPVAIGSGRRFFPDEDTTLHAAYAGLDAGGWATMRYTVPS